MLLVGRFLIGHSISSREVRELDQEAGKKDSTVVPSELLPQPPPDAPGPPAGEAALKSRRKFGWMSAVGIASMLALVVYLTRPIVIRSHRNSAQTSAVSSLRFIGMGLLEFESEYRRFPDKTTAAQIKRKTGTKLTLSDRTSNDVFVQLITAGLAEERRFDTYSKSANTPDGVCNSDATALAHGETGFAYVSGLSPNDNPSLPLVFGPVIPGTSRLDPTAFDGMAVVLKLDNSVTSLPISPDGKIISNGHDLLDPKNPLWGGKAPDVKWPK